MSADVAATYCATLIDEWIRWGVTDAFVSPGSRSTPFALALAGDERMRVHVHHDERSSAFMALGRALAERAPTVVLTTSGTAAVELHPAIVEAHQAHVPLIAVTADRPPELQGVGAPQTIDQQRLYGSAARWFVEPGPPEERHRDGWRSLARDLVRAATFGVPGPVHLNQAFREPLVGRIGVLPAPVDEPDRRSPDFGLTGEQLGALAGCARLERGVIVAGVRAARTSAEVDAVLALAETCGWPVLADHLSGLRVEHPAVVTTFDPLLRVDEIAAELRPEVVLRIGGLLSSRVTNEWLAASGAHQIGLDRWGVCPDPDHVLAATLRADVAEACRQLDDLVGRDHDPNRDRRWCTAWRDAERRARAAIDETTAGEPAVAAAALEGVGDGGALVVSSSMPVRDLEWYVGPRPSVRVLANRGANGIDGVVSSAVGVALGGGSTVCLVGDVAFLHDSNALLGLARRDVDLAIVVVDNDGGGIFSFLPQRGALGDKRFEQLFGTPHGVDLAALARVHQLRVEPAGDAGAVRSALTAWRERGGVVVVVVTSDRDANVETHRALNAAVRDAVRGGSAG